MRQMMHMKQNNMAGSCRGYMNQTTGDFQQLDLDQLNPQQREAVTSQGNPLLVLAGAGSGKTRVITSRIAWCIEAFHADPRSILAVTFTNKAADEMRERVARMVDRPRASQVMIKTFHSFGTWLLRRYGDRIGLNPDFTIYDDSDSLTLLHTIYPHWKRNELKPYVKAISRAKDRGLGPQDDLSKISRDHRLAEMYGAYQRRLREIGNVDFGDLIFRAVQLLQRDTELKERLRNRFSYILVDEYQDSNGTQFSLLKELYRPGTELCVVGDDDQSIYRFRGAEVENILQFPDFFPGTKTIKLEENYRSTGSILAVASELVSNNQGRHAKTLWTSKGSGKKPVLAFVSDHRREAEFCADLVSGDHGYDSTAILYRTNAQSAAFETLFVQRGIPYKIVGALRFYDREEVKDALALISCIMNPADAVSFRRIINKPARGIGKASLDAILKYAEPGAADDEEGIALSPRMNCIEAAETALGRAEVKGKAASGVKQFLSWYRDAEAALETTDLAEWVQQVLKQSGIIEHHARQDEISATQKVSNLEQFINETARYQPGKEGLRDFLENLQLDPSRAGGKDPADQPGVTLITMHNTKGLEFERVIITGLEEGLFPGSMNESDEEIEEERRIFYVSITRAQKELYFTSCRRRSLWGRTSMQMPSRFLRELPREHIEIIGGSQQDLISPSLTDGFDGGMGSGNGYGMKFGRRYGGSSESGSGFGSSSGSSSGYHSRSAHNSEYRNRPQYQSGGDYRNRAGYTDGIRQKRKDAAAGGEENAAQYSRGDKVYHDQYGAGWITESRVENGREIVTVKFETGKNAQFLPAYSPLEKIAAD